MAEENLQPAVDWLAHVLADNVGKVEWVDKTPEEMEASKKQGIDYPYKVIRHPIPPGNTIALEDKVRIVCDSQRTRDMVIGLATAYKQEQEKNHRLRTELENTQSHPMPGKTLGGKDPVSKFEVNLSDKRAIQLESLRRRLHRETVEEAVPVLVEMVYDRLDRGYWRYLAVCALTQRFTSYEKWHKEHPHDDRYEKERARMFEHLTELTQQKGKESPQALFQKWADAWHDETMAMSVGHHNHWAFFAIMSLGEEAVPWILKHYAHNRHIMWHGVLVLLTGVDPTQEKNRQKITDQMVGLNVQGIQQNWLEWGREQGLLNE
jgi:hypothetical protein